MGCKAQAFVILSEWNERKIHTTCCHFEWALRAKNPKKFKARFKFVDTSLRSVWQEITKYDKNIAKYDKNIAKYDKNIAKYDKMSQLEFKILKTNFRNLEKEFKI